MNGMGKSDQSKIWNRNVLAGPALALIVLCAGVQPCLFVSGREAGAEQEAEGEAIREQDTLSQIMPPGPGYEKEPDEVSLHAKAAVLMDMDSGRVLYEKNGSEVLPMASTTKIMTCITALELGNTEDIVTVSAYASAQPKVRLGMRCGQHFRLEDLLYSLMLESHNDAAVAIAEHIGTGILAKGSAEGADQNPAAENGGGEGEWDEVRSRAAVKAFCDAMNQKAERLGCIHTCFLTPNGLDAQVQTDKGECLQHSTTAEELARLMSYCVTKSPAREEFLRITRTGNYTFTDEEGKHSYSCVNHNAMLQMSEDAISGKTGFTGKAGYCYTGAFENEGRHYAIALLACGWPNHKTWKWADCRQLLDYGKECFALHSLSECKIDENAFAPVTVLGAKADGIGQPVTAGVEAQTEEEQDGILLLREDEMIRCKVERKDTLQAPAYKGTQTGSICYSLNGSTISRIPIVLSETVENIDYLWCLEKVVEKYYCL